jgi:hypothetical protein
MLEAWWSRRHVLTKVAIVFAAWVGLVAAITAMALAIGTR